MGTTYYILIILIILIMNNRTSFIILVIYDANGIHKIPILIDVKIKETKHRISQLKSSALSVLFFSTNNNKIISRLFLSQHVRVIDREKRNVARGIVP